MRPQPPVHAAPAHAEAVPAAPMAKLSEPPAPPRRQAAIVPPTSETIAKEANIEVKSEPAQGAIAGRGAAQIRKCQSPRRPRSKRQKSEATKVETPKSETPKSEATKSEPLKAEAPRQEAAHETPPAPAEPPPQKMAGAETKPVPASKAGEGATIVAAIANQ